MSRDATELSIDSVLGRDYVWDLVRSLHGRCNDDDKNEIMIFILTIFICRMSTRVHIGIQKKAGKI